MFEATAGIESKLLLAGNGLWRVFTEIELQIDWKTI